jgi:hypothetical protein
MENIFIENSFYKDDKSKEKITKNILRLKNMFWMNFVGFVALRRVYPDNQKVLSYFQTDLKMRVAKITDENNDFSLVVKLFHDAGFLPTSVVDKITRFMVILKKGNPVKENIFRDDILKSIFTKGKMSKIKGSKKIMSFVNDFYEGKSTLTEIIPGMFDLAIVNKAYWGKEFVTIARPLVVSNNIKIDIVKTQQLNVVDASQKKATFQTKSTVKQISAQKKSKLDEYLDQIDINNVRTNSADLWAITFKLMTIDENEATTLLAKFDLKRIMISKNIADGGVFNLDLIESPFINKNFYESFVPVFFKKFSYGVRTNFLADLKKFFDDYFSKEYVKFVIDDFDNVYNILPPVNMKLDYNKFFLNFFKHSESEKFSTEMWMALDVYYKRHHDELSDEVLEYFYNGTYATHIFKYSTKWDTNKNVRAFLLKKGILASYTDLRADEKSFVNFDTIVAIFKKKGLHAIRSFMHKTFDNSNLQKVIKHNNYIDEFKKVFLDDLVFQDIVFDYIEHTNSFGSALADFEFLDILHQTGNKKFYKNFDYIVSNAYMQDKEVVYKNIGKTIDRYSDDFIKHFNENHYIPSMYWLFENKNLFHNETFKTDIKPLWNYFFSSGENNTHILKFMQTITKEQYKSIEKEFRDVVVDVSYITINDTAFIKLFKKLENKIPWWFAHYMRPHSMPFILNDLSKYKDLSVEKEVVDKFLRQFETIKIEDILSNKQFIIITDDIIDSLNKDLRPVFQYIIDRRTEFTDDLTKEIIGTKQLPIHLGEINNQKPSKSKDKFLIAVDEFLSDPKIDLDKHVGMSTVEDLFKRDDPNQFYSSDTENYAKIIEYFYKNKRLLKHINKLTNDVNSVSISKYRFYNFILDYYEKLFDHDKEAFIEGMDGIEKKARNKIILRFKNKATADSVIDRVIDPKKSLIQPNSPDVDKIRDALKFNNFTTSVKATQRKKENVAEFVERIGTMEVKDIPDLQIEPIEMTKKDKEDKIIGWLDNNRAKCHGDRFLDVLDSFSVKWDTKEYEKFKTEYPDTELKGMFHGCGSIAASMILRFGFTVKPSSKTRNVVGGAGRMLGDGVYCAPNIDKVVGYCSDGSWTHRGDEIAYIFEMDVLLGKQGVHYREAGSSGDKRIRSLEYCLIDFEKQINVRKVYRVKKTNVKYAKHLKAQRKLEKENGENNEKT